METMLESAQRPEPVLVEAHLADRFRASHMDAAVLFFIVLAAYILLAKFAGLGQLSREAGELIILVASSIYGAALESSRIQATFGKKSAGLAVTDLAGRRVSFWRAFVRNMAKAVSAPLGWGWWAFHNEHGQRFHDWCSGCRVVRRKDLGL
jgi:uncharacterized RDD family membrane protein YckC